MGLVILVKVQPTMVQSYNKVLGLITGSGGPPESLAMCKRSSSLSGFNPISSPQNVQMGQPGDSNLPSDVSEWTSDGLVTCAGCT